MKQSFKDIFAMYSWKKMHQCAAIIVVTVIFLPFAMGLGKSLFTLSPAISSPSLPVGHSLLASVVVSLASACLATFLGGVIAVGQARFRPAYSFLVSAILLLPFLCPPSVWAMAQMYCYSSDGVVARFFGDKWGYLVKYLGPGNYLATTLVLSQIAVPLCCLLIARGCRRLQASGWIAADHYLRFPRRCRWIISGMKKELATSLLLAFAISIGNFSVPHVLQCRLYIIEVYIKAINYLDRTGAIMSSLPLLCMSLIPAFAIAFLLFDSKPHTSKTRSVTVVGRGAVRRLYLCFLWAYLSLVCILPVACLFVQCGSVITFMEVSRDALPELSNTILFGAIVSAGTVSLGMISATCEWPNNNRVWVFINILPVAISPLVIGLVSARFGSMFGARIANVILANGVLIYALCFRAWPFVIRAMSLGYHERSTSWSESAKLYDMNVFRRLRYIDIPYFLPHLAAAATIAFVMSVGEVEISQMLCAPGHGTLSLRLITFLHFAPPREVASLALLQMLVAVSPLALYCLCFRKHHLRVI